MKTLPGIDELIETARRDAKHCIYSVKEEQFADSISAPLFAAIQERDGEIERLRGLMSQAYQHGSRIWHKTTDRDTADQAAHIMQYSCEKARNGTTEPEPAKPQPEACLKTALGPVLDWYQSGESNQRSLIDIVKDIVSDLQQDRAAALVVSSAAQDALELCHQIECCGSSEELTKASLMASALRAKLSGQSVAAKPQPETFEAHGEVWTRHKPGDPMPVDGETLVLTYLDWDREKEHRVHTAKKAKDWLWGNSPEHNHIIGYRLADEAKPNKSETCEHCGGTNIQQSGCPRCGAPVCCDDCCKQAAQEFAKPDPYAHLREAEAQGKVIQCNAGTRDHPNWVDIQAGCKFAFSPELYRVKPWELPAPPEGCQWHRMDAWTEDMLRPGERPLLLGEKRQKGDEYQYRGDTGWGPCQVFAEPSTMADEFYRTRRPLPEPETWIDLGPEDVPPGSVFRTENESGYLVPTCVYEEGIYFHDEVNYRRTYSQLTTTNQINRSLPLTGKWDAEAWEPCRKKQS